MRYLPIFLDVQGRTCLLVGGGEVAARKAQTLRRAGARLRVVAPTLVAPLRADLGPADEIRERAFLPEDLHGAWLVIVATDDPLANATIARLSADAGIPVNAVDDPANCSFVMPALVDRSPVIVAVSTGGASPVLARKLRARLEAAVPPAIGRLAALAGRHRARVQAELPQARRRDFWERALEGPVAERVFAGDDAAAERMLLELLTAPTPQPAGEVQLVHAGPGAADLLTLRALRQLQRASRVLHDPGLTPEVLDLARRDASLQAAAPDEQVGIAIDAAAGGECVCVLRVGSGFAEAERARLRAAGVAWGEVPGVDASDR